MMSSFLADEPVIPVRVAVGEIAEMIISVVHDCARKLRVVVVAAEQALLFLAQSDADLARAHFDGRAVVVQELYVVQRGGFSH